MYINQNASKKWIDPERRAELLKRDRIRQAYYARLEREKNGVFDEDIKRKQLEKDRLEKIRIFEEEYKKYQDIDENIEKPKRKKTKG